MTNVITDSDMPLLGELQLKLPWAPVRSFEDVYGKADEAATEPELELLPYQVRSSVLASAVGNGTISLGVGRGSVSKSSHGAVYRVTGATEDREVVARLADELVGWLNYPHRVSMSPRLIVVTKSARIVLTPSGRREGFLQP